MKLLPEANRKPGPKALHEVSMKARRRWHDDTKNCPTVSTDLEHLPPLPIKWRH